jgi:hypothetical protein
MKQLKKIALLFISIIALQACYPGDSIPIADLDTASTFYIADDFTPKAPASAAILWEVVRIKSSDPSNDLDYNGEVDSEILNTALDNLVKIYGASNVYIISETDVPSPKPSNSQVDILTPNDVAPNTEAVYAPSIKLTRETVAIVYPGYPWYPGWGGGWYPGYPGYPCYYCSYPPTVSYESFDVGTIVLDMFDLRQIPASGQVPSDFDPAWVGVFKGLISSSATSNADRVVEKINQAFEQSPYLEN